MLRRMLTVGTVAALLALPGCTAMTSLMLDTKDKVEVLIGEQGAGTYTVTAAKDGTTLKTWTIRCEQGLDGKLAGCHPL